MRNEFYFKGVSMLSSTYLYFYARHLDNEQLCRLEMRSFFNMDTKDNFLTSPIKIDPTRSIFIKGRLDIFFSAKTWPELVDTASAYPFDEGSFKVSSLNTTTYLTTAKHEMNQRRKLEREIGLAIEGEADLQNPQQTFAFVEIEGEWFFGLYHSSKAVALKHRKKPHSYSTALSSGLARTVANIAAPFPEGLKLIDPCCGIGNVLIEALSMDFSIVGSDINWLVVKHTRENIAYFNYSCEVETRGIADVTEFYDVAIIDMPYNIFTSASPVDQQHILTEARRIAKKAVIVSIDTIDEMIERANFQIIDRCEAKKSTFIRQILICE